MSPIVIDIETVAIPDADTYLPPASAPDNYKDPEKIAAYIRDARARQLEKASLDVDLGKVIALGIRTPDQPTFVMTESDTPEVHMLSLLWQTWHDWRDRSPMLVTFGGLEFDVPFLLRRSLYLGVPAPYLSCDKYRHPQQIDLMSILSMQGKLTWRGLQFYLQRFGYPKAGTDITGAEIAQCYAEGNWAAIAEHCRNDVDATAWLGERIGAIPKRAAVGQTVGAF